MTSKKTAPHGAVSDSRTRRLALGRTLGTSLALAASQATAGLAFLLLARGLPIDRFGAFAALYAASTGLSTLLDFGSSQKWTRELARSINLHSYHHWLRRRTLAQLPMVATFAFLASVVIRDDVLSNTVVVVLSMQALTSTLSSGSLAAVRALISPARAIWFMFTGNLFFLACVVVAPATSLLLAGAVGASGSWLITAFLGLVSTRHLLGDGSASAEGNPWAGTAGFGLFGLAVALQPFDVVILGAIAGASEAGRYSAVSKWVQPVLLVSYAYGANAFPALAAAKSDREALSKLGSSVPVLVIVGFMTLAIVVLAPWLVSTLLGPQYEDSVILLRLLALWCVPVAINQPCVSFLQARGQERFLATVTLAVTTANLAFIAALASLLGAAVIPIVSLAGFSGLAVILVLRVRRSRVAIVA